MSRARYTVTTTGNTTVVHLENPHNYPRAEFIGFRQDEGDARAARPAKPKPKRAQRRSKRKGR